MNSSQSQNSDMDKRLKKFMDNDFGVSDLDVLKNDIFNMSDEELSLRLDQLDCSDDFSADEIDRIRQRLNTEILQSRKKRFFSPAIAAAAVVAVILIAAAMSFMVSVHNENRKYGELMARNIEITTEEGEHIHTVLPDGSKVAMSPASALSYRLDSFNDTGRHIRFSGEASFSVSKNENAPFMLHSTDFEIRVLGTVFSVLSRDSRETVEIHLDEGSIELTAVKSNNRRIMKQGETAVITRESGAIDIYEPGSGHRFSVGKGALFFSSETLSGVCRDLTLYYGRNFCIDNAENAGTFTGSLPTDNLEQALYILQQTLSLRAVTSDSVITLSSVR